MTNKNNDLQQKIFEYFLEQYNLTLLEGEINDIEHLVNAELMKEFSNVYMQLNAANTAATANLHLQQMQEKELEETAKQYNAVVEQNRQLQQERMRLISDNNFVRAELNQIKLLLEGKNTQCSGFEERSEKYLKALDEIENFAKRHCNTCEDNGQQLCSSNYCYRHYLLDIISKAKDGEK